MKSTNEQRKEAAAQSANAFTSTLGLLNKGAFPAEAGEALAEVIRAVRETGVKGKVMITLDIVPVAKTEGAQVTITPNLATKTPKLGAKARTFFTDTEGNLHRQDPNQLGMDFEIHAPAPKAEPAPKKTAGNAG